MSAPAKSLDVPKTGEHKAVSGGVGLGARLLGHDLLVVIGAIVLLAAGWFIHRAMTRPKMAVFSMAGLTMEYPADLGLREPLVPPRAPPATISLRRAGDARTRVEVVIEPRSIQLGSMAAGRELERANRYGQLYNRVETGVRSVNGRDWLRTRYSYVASAAGGGEGEGALATWAIEYAWPADGAVNSRETYVVTVHGSEEGAASLESTVLESLRLNGGNQ